MLIQAHARKKESTHEVGGKKYKFAANEVGDFVCDVQEQGALARFLSLPEGFRPYGADEDVPAPQAQASAAASAPEKAAGEFVLSNGDATVDLGAMGDDELKQFAKGQNLQIDGRLKGDKLRKAIADAITDDEAED